MAKVKAIQFFSDFCYEGEIKYPSGSIHPQNEDTLRCIKLNFAEIVTVDSSLVTPTAVEVQAATEAAQIAADIVASEQAAAEAQAAQPAAEALPGEDHALS